MIVLDPNQNVFQSSVSIEGDDAPWYQWTI